MRVSFRRTISSFALLGAVTLLSQVTFAASEDDTADDPSSSPTIEPLSDYELGKYQYCGSDADCMKAINGCCDCANGGVTVAVNKNRFRAFRSRFDCSEVKCSEDEKAPRCDDGVVTCLLGKCKFVSDPVFNAVVPPKPIPRKSP